ncbi:NADH-quinone oxidoreductase subunit M [Schaalia meyeri]|uniref:NADH-quinone oxidoreductase subunit M n=1 Tax=Schaalia meyeri TaxID=52773 RepID=A0AAP9Y8M0_9ACTO|nr:NADH-quinone oxidoreductase subunit M [Schaalia meyeri]QQC43925.1 NADH-quinone oxidoreductase subunit M [Schaalia meyeri]SDR77919.1 NADH dehydrogenase subunit M [Schaalia meyeri]
MVDANFPWLSVLVAVPAAGAALLGLVPPLRRAAGRMVALAVALVELALGIVVAVTAFDWSAPASYQVYETHAWIPQMGISWSLGVTSLGLVMILLALGLVPLVLVAGWNEDEASDRGAYPALVLALQAFMVVIFAAYDLAVFYFAFEAMLVPLYVMIGRHGVGQESARHKAAMKFLLYSLFGGLVMLGGILFLWAIGSRSASDVSTFFRLDSLAQVLPNTAPAVQMVVFWTFLVAFAIKAPMVPVHTWLPDTAAAARPGTSVLLVGVLDKIGTFGMITLCLQLTPGAAASAKWAVCVLAVISILWGGLSANGQSDIMRLVSYTSVSHFGFMVLGIFIGSHLALVGAMFYMVAHGVSIAAMFLLSGWLSRRGGSQDMREYVGMQRVTPVLSGLWLISGLASIALPGLSGFVPEYLVLMGTWKVSAPLALFAVLGVVIAAMYVLMPYQRVFTGAPGKGKEDLADLCTRERCVMTPLVIAMLVLGIWSAPLVGALTPVASDLDLDTAPVPAAAEGSAQ